MLVPMAPKRRELTTRWREVLSALKWPIHGLLLADDVLAQMTCFRDPTFCGAATGSLRYCTLGSDFLAGITVGGDF